MTKFYTKYTDDDNYNIITNIKNIIYDVKKNSNNLPLSIVNLKYYQDDNIFVNNLSSNLQVLKFNGSSFNNNLNNLPHSLKYLYTGYYFHKELENLPPNLKALEHGDYFDKKIKNLPQNLVKLDTGRCCKLINKNFPKTLTCIQFGLLLNIKNFNYFNILPGLVKYVYSYCDYAYFNSNNLPKSVLHLVYGKTYCSNLNNLSSKLEYLNVETNILKHSNLPYSLKKVYFSGSPHNNIQNSKNLTLNLISNAYVYNNSDIKKYNKFNNLPINLKNLDIYDNYNMTINNLPSKINKIEIYDNNSRCFNNLPKSIKYFKYICDYPNNKIPLCNELVITTLTLYNNNMLDFIPEGIQQLRIIDFENHDQKKVIDPRYNRGYYFTYVSYCKINDLPSSINKIIIDKNYKDNVNKIYHHKLKFN